MLAPLRAITGQPALQSAVSAYEHAPANTQTTWTSAYEKALGNATANPNGSIKVKPGNYGPLSTMMTTLLTFAQSGALDGTLLSRRQFYQTDYTLPLLFLADGTYLANRAQHQHLLGNQWGMMNETGNYPGQAWLWLYTFWYQINPYNTSTNADALVMGTMGILSLAFVLVPFIPGVRSIPRRIPVYRIIWRQHYRTQQAGGA